MTTSQRVRAAYADLLGEPEAEMRFEQNGLPVSVLKYAPSPATGEVTLYLTAGISDLLQPDYKDEYRLEFYLGLLPEVDEVAQSLAWLGLMPQFTGVPLVHGNTWRYGEPVIPGYDFTGFFVLLSGDPIVPQIEVDGLHVRVLTAVPLFTDELDYFRAHGTDALWDRMEEKDVPMWDPRRVSTFHDAG
ncbi:suppressor of fused domain protein [Actinoplanes sp. RD1]|uniref:suppressor of fused domain protein n=1 Tax=Actinoplanes sp. RD1 TaxID=3064538 RepID=UPI0027428026|nr:suppressor of fused domain protein [Actinoplanes sp. RD1]